MFGLKPGFLGDPKPAQVTTDHSSTKKETLPAIKQPPLVFKVDFTFVEGKMSIFELGHSSSDNSQLEDGCYNLFQFLNKKYRYVYISGDHPMCITIILGSSEKEITPPIYVPIEELVNIRTEDSIVVIQRNTTPIHFSTYEIQQTLKKHGSSLVVFDAEPLSCLVAYEKIIMQRLQLLAKNMALTDGKAESDSCAHPTILINIKQNIQEQLQEQLAHFDWKKVENFIVKPANSSQGDNIFCCNRSNLLLELEKLTRTCQFSTSYHRSAEDALKYLSIGTSTALTDKITTLKDIGRELGVDSLTDHLNTNIEEDPFFIIQPVISDSISCNKKKYLPTYRTFILAHRYASQPHDISIILLSKILRILPENHYTHDHPRIATKSVVAGNKHNSGTMIVSDKEQERAVIKALSSSHVKKFFSLIFDRHNVEDSLCRHFPELRAYWNTMCTYPPYQYIFNLSMQKTEMAKYQNIILLYRLIRFTGYNTAEPLATALVLLELYQNIKHHHTLSPNFVNKFADHIHTRDEEIKNFTPLYRTDPLFTKLTIKYFLQLLDVYTDAIKIAKKTQDISSIIDCVDNILEWVVLLSPKAEKLSQLPRNQESIELFTQKICRDVVIDLCIKLINLKEYFSKERSIKKADQDNIAEKTERLTRWATLYFQSISVALPEQPPDIGRTTANAI